MKTLRLVIHGRVQGVWFRESMRLKAEQLGITGWVRNRADGTVEAVVQGDEPQMASMIEWAHSGPPQASVTRLDQIPIEGKFQVFQVRATASNDQSG